MFPCRIAAQFLLTERPTESAMLFDPTKLPKDKWLSLDDVVHICAFGEPYVNGICEVGYPSDRAFAAEINETARRCLAEAGTAPKYSAFVELLNKPGLWKADAVAPLLFKCKPWPRSGQRLYDLFLQYDEAQADELKKLEAATTQLEGCLMSGAVIFEGDRNGRRDRIDPRGIYGLTIIWQNRTVSAHPRDPQPGTRLFVWQEVLIERASLVRWLSNAESTASGQATPARAAIEESSAQPAQAKMTPGRTPYEREWRIIKPIACAIYKEHGPYDRSVGFTLKRHAEMSLNEFGKLQENDPEKYGSLQLPSLEWATKRLREIRAELDKIIIEYD
jgi:hypothetical protein